MSTKVLSRVYAKALRAATALYGDEPATLPTAEPARQNPPARITTLPIPVTYLGESSKYSQYLRINDSTAISLELMVEHWRVIADTCKLAGSRKAGAKLAQSVSSAVAKLWTDIEFDASVRVTNGVSHSLAIQYAIECITQHESRSSSNIVAMGKAIALVRSFAMDLQ